MIQAWYDAGYQVGSEGKEAIEVKKMKNLHWKPRCFVMLFCFPLVSPPLRINCQLAFSSAFSQTHLWWHPSGEGRVRQFQGRGRWLLRATWWDEEWPCILFQGVFPPSMHCHLDSGTHLANRLVKMGLTQKVSRWGRVFVHFSFCQ